MGASALPCPENNTSAHAQEIAVKISMESTKEKTVPRIISTVTFLSDWLPLPMITSWAMLLLNHTCSPGLVGILESDCREKEEGSKGQRVSFRFPCCSWHSRSLVPAHLPALSRLRVPNPPTKAQSTGRQVTAPNLAFPTSITYEPESQLGPALFTFNHLALKNALNTQVSFVLTIISVMGTDMLVIFLHCTLKWTCNHHSKIISVLCRHAQSLSPVWLFGPRGL